jgi:hypothetical protein
MIPAVIIAGCLLAAVVIRYVLWRRSANPALRCPRCNRPMRVSRIRKGTAIAYRCPKRSHDNYRITGGKK